VTELSYYTAFEGVGGAMTNAWHAAPDRLHRFLDANAELLKRIHVFEDDMDDITWIARESRPPMQVLMCRMGVGNEKAFVGRDGWLGYEPGLRSLTGPGFLEPRQLRKRARSGDETSDAVQPNPVTGIVHFRDELRRHDIELVVVPVPVKPSIYPDVFSSRYTQVDAAVQNSSYDAFCDQLNAAGVHLYDPAATLTAQRKLGQAYLKTDTHWTPAAMQRVAEDTAQFITNTFSLPAGSSPGVASVASVTNLGDIASMLDLPTNQTLYAAELVEIQPLAAAKVDASADVLVLGDSFANIYSQGLMNWGEHAGYAEQLSIALARPVDSIIENDGGAHATRWRLQTDLRSGKDRLANTRVVVWMFAARELALGDWKELTIERPTQTNETVAPAPSPDANIVARGTVAAVSSGPKKGALYKHFISKFYLTDLVDDKGQPIGNGAGVVHVFGMRDRVILPIASTPVGGTLQLTLNPWEAVSKKYGSLKSGQLDDFMLEIDNPLYWGEPTSQN
jgi:alginate O-acetyltransferase complex protein AlgJ